jgi:hypothetical protein
MKKQQRKNKEKLLTSPFLAKATGDVAITI